VKPTTHDWVNNMKANSVLERDGQVTFEEAVKKRYMYCYDLVDVMAEMASVHPKASTDRMNMRDANDDNDNSSSSSSSLSATGKDEEEYDDVSAAEKKAKAEEEQEEEQNNHNNVGFLTASFPAPPTNPMIAGAMAITAINSSVASSIVTSSLTTKTVAGKKRKEKTAKNSKNKKAKRQTKRLGTRVTMEVPRTLTRLMTAMATVGKSRCLTSDVVRPSFNRRNGTPKSNITL
jgi:hypothetical protein